MEFAAGVPLAVGAAALRALNSYLYDKKVAIAWFGDDYEVFTSNKCVHGKLGICISHVFSVPETECVRLIADSLQNSQSWFWSRATRGGECCWLPMYRTLKGNTIAKARSALFSLGAVGSLPAARIDAWGLVVMAYANGATL